MSQRTTGTHPAWPMQRHRVQQHFRTYPAKETQTRHEFGKRYSRLASLHGLVPVGIYRATQIRLRPHHVPYNRNITFVQCKRITNTTCHTSMTSKEPYRSPSLQGIRRHTFDHDEMAQHKPPNENYRTALVEIPTK